MGATRSGIIIRARRKWNPTGVLVDAGERYHFETQGEWSDSGIRAGGDGFPSERAPRITRGLLRRFESHRRVPTEFWFCLIGSVGEDPSRLFRIGRERSDWLVEPGHRGEILCFANDVGWAYWNNCGALELAVTRTG